VTLPPFARDVLEQCRKARPPGVSPYVFAGRYDSAFSSFARAKEQIDEAVKAYCAEARLPVPAEWTLHDLRRSVGTGLARLKVPTAQISKVLNHREGGVTAKIYVQYQYDAEIREALELWGRHLTGLLAGGKAKAKPVAA
jgi:integrase